MRIKQLFFSLKNIIIRFYKIGVDKEKNESYKKYIVLVNIAAISTVVVTFFMAIVWIFFTPDLMVGLSAILDCFILVIPVFLNSKGYPLAAKKYMTFSTLNVLLFSSCIFSHKAGLEKFYYADIAVFSFIFSEDERKWTYISILSAVVFYIIEVTPFHNLLPDLKLVKGLDKSSLINNCGSISMSLLEMIPYIYITRQWQTQLLSRQKMLEDTQHQLQIQNNDLQTFGIAASHSLQTPVHISKFFFTKVKKYFADPEHTNFPEKNVTIINESLQQMDQLISGLFSYARIIKIQASNEFCNIISEIAIIKKRMEEKYANSVVVIPEMPVYITTNKILFLIIMQTLIDNGLKYNSSEKPCVHLHVEIEEKMISFYILDNGIGIEEDFIGKLFEPFKKINSGNSYAGGNGLGLSGAKRAAERIGATLFCKQSSNKGSIFQLNVKLDRY